MKNYYFILLLAISCIACGSKSTPNNNDNGNNSTITNTEDVNAAYNEGYKNGFNNGYIDGSERKGYMYSYNYNRDNHYKTYNAGKAYIDAYREGYPKGFKEGETLANYEAKQAPEEYEINNVTVTTSNTPNTYSTPNVSNSTLHSDEKIYGDFYNYKETNDCVEGVVVYEGRGGYYIVETKQGYTILEDYSGTLFEDAMIRGELNQYNNKYIINRNKNQEIKVYIENYMLSDRKAVEWMGKNNHLKSDDQGAYDANNQ